MFEAYYKSPIGNLKILGNESHIVEIGFSNDFYKIKLIPKHLQVCIEQLNEYFQGNRKEFSFSINPAGTEFQSKVWNSLLKIPYGQTISYHEMANNMENVKAIRAIASANGKNPIAIVIPCHRVIGKDGSLTGYAGGLLKKQWLLEHEGAIQQKSLFW